MFRSEKSRNIFFILTFLLILVGVASFYVYKKLNTIAHFEVKNELSVEQQEVSDILTKVGRLMILPTDEEVAIATVTTLENLEGQTFFANAQIGDKVLVYKNNRKAILYNPTLDKIIEVSPVNFTSDSTEESTETPKSQISTTTATTVNTVTKATTTKSR